MAYNTQLILRDAEDKPIPQVWDEAANAYRPLAGTAAGLTVPLPGGAATDAAVAAVEAAIAALAAAAATDASVDAVTAAVAALQAVAATEATLAAASAKLPASLGIKADAASLSVGLSTEQRALLAAIATDATLTAASAKLPASLGIKADAASLSVGLSTEQRALLAALLSGTTFSGVLGEVQASPTANTVLDRLKALLTELALKADLTETQPVSLASVPSHAVTGPLTDAQLRAATVPVTEASATAIAASLSVLDDWDETDRAKVNPIAGQIGVQGGSGVVTALTQRVVLATDVAPPSHPVTNAGTFATQSASAGDVAHDGVDSGSPVKQGFQARTTDQTAVATADRVNGVATVLGKQIVKLDAIPDLTWNYAAPAAGLVNTSGVTAKAAGAGAVRNYIKGIQVINSHQTISTEVVVRDGAAGTVLHRGWAQAAGGGYAAVFDPPLRGSAATLVEIGEVTATATAGVLVNLQGFQAAE